MKAIRATVDCSVLRYLYVCLSLWVNLKIMRTDLFYLLDLQQMTHNYIEINKHEDDTKCAPSITGHQIIYLKKPK